MKKKHGSAHVDQHGLQGIVTVSYKTYRNTYQISRYVSLVEKVYRYTATVSALLLQLIDFPVICRKVIIQIRPILTETSAYLKQTVTIFVLYLFPWKKYFWQSLSPSIMHMISLSLILLEIWNRNYDIP